MPDSEKNDPSLSFATFEDIMEELGRRFRVVVLLTTNDARNNDDATASMYGFKGSIFEAAGLCGVYERQLQNLILFPEESED